MSEPRNTYWYWQDPKSRINYEGNNMNDETRKPAISVIDEASREYYARFNYMPDQIKKQASAHMLHEIFKYMVTPAITEVRRLDREHLAGDTERLREALRKINFMSYEGVDCESSEYYAISNKALRESNG